MTLPLAIDLVRLLVAAGLSVWIYLHCARPCLVASGARPAATNIVLAATVLVVVGHFVEALSTITDVERSVAWRFWEVTSATWIVIVGIGYFTEFKTLIWATGGALTKRRPGL